VTLQVVANRLPPPRTPLVSDQLNPSQISWISGLELRAGFPQGFSQRNVLSSLLPAVGTTRLPRYGRWP